jgi:hypothetical protein
MTTPLRSKEFIASQYYIIHYGGRVLGVVKLNTRSLQVQKGEGIKSKAQLTSIMINLLNCSHIKAGLIVAILEKGLAMTIARLVVNIHLDEVELRRLGGINTLESALVVLVLQLLLAQRNIAGIVAELKVQSSRDLMLEVEVVNTSTARGSDVEKTGLFVVDGTGEGFAAVLGFSVFLIESFGSN